MERNRKQREEQIEEKEEEEQEKEKKKNSVSESKTTFYSKDVQLRVFHEGPSIVQCFELVDQNVVPNTQITLDFSPLTLENRAIADILRVLFQIVDKFSRL